MAPPERPHEETPATFDPVQADNSTVADADKALNAFIPALMH